MKIITLMLLFSTSKGRTTLQPGFDRDLNQLLIELLPRYIHRARCESQCAQADDKMEQGRCLDICAMPARPGICDYAWLCGRACALGCTLHDDNDDRQEEQGRHEEVSSLQGFREEGCRGVISWSLVPEVSGANYVIAGKDGAGMWSVLAKMASTPDLLLSVEDRDRFQQLAIVAVDGQGLIDAVLLPVAPVEDDCDRFLLVDWQISFGLSAQSYALFAASLLLFVLVALCSCHVVRATWCNSADKNDSRKPRSLSGCIAARCVQQASCKDDTNVLESVVLPFIGQQKNEINDDTDECGIEMQPMCS